MPNRMIEIHDCVFEKVLSLENSVELHFSCVYIHQSEGRPGIDPGSGWIQRAILRIGDDLTNGQIQLGEYHEGNVIPIPLNFTGGFALQLTPMWHPDEHAVLVWGRYVLPPTRQKFPWKIRIPPQNAVK